MRVIFANNYYVFSIYMIKLYKIKRESKSYKLVIGNMECQQVGYLTYLCELCLTNGARILLRDNQMHVYLHNLDFILQKL